MTPEPVRARAELAEEQPAVLEDARVQAMPTFAERGQRWLRRWRWPLLLLLVAVVFCEAAWLTYLTSGEADLAHYECYGLTFWLGSHGANLLPQTYCSFLPQSSQPALHMLPLEYPPLTLLLFSLPLLTPLPLYTLVFALLMTSCAGLIYWLLDRSGARQAAPLFLLYLLLGAAGVFQERFDLLPAACTLLCLLFARRERWLAAYLALALGVLLKLYPLVMLPALFLAEQQARLNAAAHSHSAQTQQVEQGSLFQRAWRDIARWNWRNCLLCVALLIGVMGSFALLNFQDAILSPLTYFLNRPPQIESLLASAIWLGGHFGAPYTLNFTFGSLNIVNSDLVRLLAPVNTLLTLVGVLALYWLQWRKRIDLGQSLVGLVCVLIVTGKVFSPQYLIWLIPLLAYVAARGQTNRLWLFAWAAISLLTTFIYLFYYSRLPDPQTASSVILTLPGFFELVALRNLLLAVTVLAYLCGWWGTRRPTRSA